MKLSLVIDPEGNLRSIYDDQLLPLAQRLGLMDVTRASEVEFNTEQQQWEATLKSGEVISREPQRQEVLAIERAVITERLINGNFN